MNTKTLCSEPIFNSIFLEYAPNLRNFLFGKCGDRQQAEDLVQEAFLRLWKNCKKVSLEKAKGYVFAISNNLLINKWKHGEVVDKYVKSRLDKPAAEGAGADPLALLVEAEGQKKIEGLIAGLPEKQRLALLMRMEGLSYKEIAGLSGVTVKAIEKRIHNAIANLRPAYKKSN